MSNKYLIAIVGIPVLIIGLIIFSYFWNKKEAAPTHSFSPIASISSSFSPSPIIYTTFSSPKADFTFEYPNTWVYDEKADPNNAKATEWGFYMSPKKNPESLIFGMGSPMTEIVDFCSINGMTSKLATYKTNDPNTYITYEQCGDTQIGHVYIYWQKGEKFSNARDIKDIYQVSLINFYFNPALPEGSEIAQHIAQSIKIK